MHQGLSKGTFGSPSRLTPQQIRDKYRQLSMILNELDRQGEEVELWHDEYRMQIKGLTARVFRNPDYKGTWGTE